MKNIVIIGLVAAATLSVTTPALAAQVTSLQSLNQLESSLTPSSRLYVVGNPEGIAEYQKVVDENPELVVVVIEESANHEQDVQYVMNTLYNFDYVRLQMINDFVGTPEALLAARIDSVTTQTKPDGTHPGYIEVTTTEAPRAFGADDDWAYSMYQQARSTGLSVPNSLAEVVAQVSGQVRSGIEGQKAEVQNGVEQTRLSITALENTISSSGYSPQNFTQATIDSWKNQLAAAAGNTSTQDGVNSAKSVIQQVAAEVSSVSGSVDQFVQAEIDAGDVRNGIILLADAVESADYVPAGFTQQQVDTWTDSLDNALGLLESGNLAEAQSIIGQVDAEVSSMTQEVNDVLSARALRRNLSLASLLLAAIGLTVSSVVTKRYRKDAEALVNEIEEELGNITLEALELSEKSAFVAINAEGLQEEKAEELNAQNAILLEQTTLLNKYLTKSRQVLDAKGLAALQHKLLPFGVMYVKAISEGKKPIALSPDDVKALTANSNEQLQTLAAQLNFTSADVSVKEVRQSYTKTFEEARALFKLLEEAESNLKKAMVDVVTGLDAFKESLDEIGDPELFNATPYEVGVVGPIGNSDGGLIAKAKARQEKNDYLGGLAEGTDPAARILRDGQFALQVTNYGGATLVPQGESTVVSFEAEESNLTSDWVFAEIGALSAELDEIIRSNSFSGTIAPQVKAQKQKLEVAVKKLENAVRLNQLRIEVWPDQLQERVDLVKESENTVLSGLQALNFYLEGDVSGLYREPDNSPKELIASYTKALQDLVELLGSGNIADALSVEANILEWNRQVDHLVTTTEARLAHYPVAVGQIDSDVTTGNTRYENLDVDEVTASRFSDYSQERAIERAGSSASTLGAAHAVAREKIDVAVNSREQADVQMNSACVLVAGTLLDSAQAAIDAGNKILVAIPAALEHLEQAVREAASQIETAQGNLRAAIRRVDEEGVRSVTRRSASAMAGELKDLQATYISQPYEALDALEGFGGKASGLAAEINADISDYQEIVRIISDAESQEFSASSAISSANSHSFTHATVNTFSADSALRSYSSQISAARQSLANENYESALSSASSAYSSVTSVPGLASSAVDDARRAHQNEVDRLAREAAAAAEAARQAAAAQQNSFNSSGGYDSSSGVDSSGGWD